MIGDECSLLLPVAQLAETASPKQQQLPVVQQSSDPSSAVTAAHTSTLLCCADLAGSLSEDSVLQIMSDSTAVKDVPTSVTLKNLGVLNLPILLTDKRKPQTVVDAPSCSEENVSDLDLSFLNETEGISIISDPKHLNENVVKELQCMIASSQSLNFLGSHVECSQVQEQPQTESSEGNSGAAAAAAAEGGGDTVMIDVSQPIQLSQNSLIVVNGQKCVLQHDARTGQVVAYPVKEHRPRRRRGRPRKTSVEQVFVSSEKNPSQETENLSEEEREKGLLEVVNDDGSLVRRSSRKRKKAKTLKDYETGNLQQELGSDVDDIEEADVEQHLNRRRKQKGPGRPRKITHSFESVSDNSAIGKERDVRHPRGRPPRKESEGEASQAFLVQTADGQTLMLQVPLSSIPPGTTLQEMAQEIANKLNIGLNQASPTEGGVEKRTEPPALQDHSIGSTTTTTTHSSLQPPSHLNGDQVLIGEEVCESQEITLECDQSLNDVTSGANLAEENNLNTPESLEDNFCLDVSSTTTSTCVDAPLLCPFNEHLIDHSFYVMRPNSPKTVPPEEDVQKDLFQGSEVVEENKVESTIIAVDTVLPSSSNPPFHAVMESQNVSAVMGTDPNSAVNPNYLTTTHELPVVSPSKGSEVLAVLLQESSQQQSAVPEKSSPIPVPAEISPPGPKKCKICTVPYFTEEEIVEHFKAKHPKCICLECNYMNEHPYGIKRHSYRHANEECVCNICNKKYKDSYILKMHVKMVHLPPEVLFKCDVCSKEFTRKAHLKRHQRIHAPVRQYRCPLCDYHGCEKSDVTKHLLIHEEPKFKCEFCGKAFRHLKNKELHLKRHSGQRDYKCAACNFYGYTYTDIRKHIERRHSAICHLCKQSFSDPELCKEHKRLGLCQSNLLEVAKIEESPPPPPPPPTLDDKKEIVLFGEMALDI